MRLPEWERSDLVLFIAGMFLTAGMVVMATAGTLRGIPRHPAFYYAELAEGFRQGRLSIPKEPPPKLIAMANPYGPEGRALTPWDHIYYNGKFYLYFAPLPALLMLPFHAVGLTFVNDGNLGAFFAIARFWISLILLALVVKKFKLKKNDAILLATAIALGWSAPFAYTVGRPAIYECAINGGQAFSLLGILFLYLLIGTKDDRRRKILLWSVGLSFGLAVGCRVTLVVPTALVLGVVLFWWRKISPVKKIRIGVAALTMGIPYGAILAILGWYNWARFGNPFDLGFRYMNSYGNFYPNNFVALAKTFILNIWLYFFVRIEA